MSNGTISDANESYHDSIAQAYRGRLLWIQGQDGVRRNRCSRCTMTDKILENIRTCLVISDFLTGSIHFNFFLR